MKKFKTLEEAQIELIELLEQEGEFRGTLNELADRLNVKPENIRPLLQLLKSSGDVLYEESEEGLIVRPAMMVPVVPPTLTPEQEQEVQQKLKEGYKVIACSTMGGVQSRELRSALGKRVIVYFRNGSKVEAKLKGFDRFCLKLRNYMGNMLAYKHAISTIVYKP
ncbi:RNA chaperone Hfq [Thermovibrio ammonificans]|uniref:Like-Sm ribonucleoprotein core n=1 Tax=Thermovibrio ammonificans (strain DSM 15698 / JCM 12110 / HB-1) TaxID=648996 RepID=E8T3Y7_THEA1|nr:RNA chaperone Hfq [Thermovibrio ammonificans]ADU96197.1 Like-Sm ribonucleoprotein core [Thermovibrio ammonificans HB-1]